MFIYLCPKERSVGCNISRVEILFGDFSIYWFVCLFCRAVCFGGGRFTRNTCFFNFVFAGHIIWANVGFFDMFWQGFWLFAVFLGVKSPTVLYTWRNGSALVVINVVDHAIKMWCKNVTYGGVHVRSDGSVV